VAKDKDNKGTGWGFGNDERETNLSAKAISREEGTGAGKSGPKRQSPGRGKIAQAEKDRKGAYLIFVELGGKGKMQEGREKMARAEHLNPWEAKR